MPSHPSNSRRQSHLLLILVGMLSFFFVMIVGGIVVLVLFKRSAPTSRANSGGASSGGIVVANDPTSRAWRRPGNLDRREGSMPFIVPVSSNPRSADEALHSLGSPDPQVRKRAVEFLARMGPGGQRSDLTLALVKLLPNEELTGDIVTALEKWGTAEAVEAVAPLAVDPEHQYQPYRKTAMMILARNHDPRVLGQVGKLLVEGNKRDDVVELLRGYGRAAQPVAARYVNHGQPNAREKAERILQITGAPPEVVIFQSILDLESEDGYVPVYARNRLNSMTVPPEWRADVASGLIRAGRKHPDLLEEGRALTRWMTAESLPELASYVRVSDKHWTIAINVMEELGLPEAAPHLMEGFHYSSHRPRISAAIEKIGPGAEEFVQPYTTHINRPTAEAACELLGKIGTEASLPVLANAQQVAKIRQLDDVVTAAEQAAAAIRSRPKAAAGP